MITGTVTLPHGMTARPARKADKNFLEKLFKDSRNDLKAAKAPRDVIEMTIDMQLAAQTSGYGSLFPNAIYLVLEKNGSRIGRVTIDIGSIDIRLVDLCFISKAQNRGYGTAIIQWAMTCAARIPRPLVVPTRRDNPALLGFLLMAGFKEDTSISDEVFARMIWFPTRDEMTGITTIKPRKAVSGNV